MAKRMARIKSGFSAQLISTLGEKNRGVKGLFRKGDKICPGLGSNIANADWTKPMLALPTYKSMEFMERFEITGPKVDAIVLCL